MKTYEPYYLHTFNFLNLLYKNNYTMLLNKNRCSIGGKMFNESLMLGIVHLKEITDILFFHLKCSRNSILHV